VSAEDVLRVARAHLDPAALQMVVVGDLARVKDPLSALGFGELTVYDTEGEQL
jgi:zinc protease